MQAIEFETYIKDGIIEIPEQYSKLNDKKIKVIIMSEEDINEVEEDINTFLKLQELVKLNKVTIDKNVNIDKLADEVNNNDIL
jgi:hypothetical protein